MEKQPERPEAPLNTPTMVRGPEGYYTAPRTSDLPVASLALGILSIFFSFLTALPGLVLGIVALYQIKGSGRQLAGAGLAIAGIVLSVLTPLILPALLLPVFMQARERARKEVCASNLKQISMATMMYTDDYDEHYPPAAHWCTVIYPYIENYAAFKCPDDDSGSRSSYALNAALGGFSAKKVGEPGDIVSSFDAHANWDLAGGAGLLALRHNGGATIGYADGHVMSVRGDSLNLLDWNPSQSPASRPSVVLRRENQHNE